MESEKPCRSLHFGNYKYLEGSEHVKLYYEALTIGCWETKGTLKFIESTYDRI
jgi:hypothetical protein